MTSSLNRFLDRNFHIIKWFIFPVWTAAAPVAVVALFSDEKNFVSLSILIVVLNIIGYGLYTINLGKSARQEKRRTKIDKLHKRWQEMIHPVEPSIFTLQHSTLRREELDGHTYVDQTQHWWVAVRIFFNPFVERQPGLASAIDKLMVNTLKGLALILKVLWTLLSIWLVLAANAAAFLPDITLWFIESLSIWLLWTALWGFISIKVWHGKRHVITDHDLMVIINRQPFEDYKPARVPIEGIQSATLVQSLAGKIFKFYTLEVDAKGNDDPAVSVLNYVRDGERVNQNIQFLMKQAKNTGYEGM